MRCCTCMTQRLPQNWDASPASCWSARKANSCRPTRTDQALLKSAARNILFLYAEEESLFHDALAQQGGCVMEVRRRKKSGQVFWASLSLSPLSDGGERATGMIAYLTRHHRPQAGRRAHPPSGLLRCHYWLAQSHLSDKAGQSGADGGAAQQAARLRAVH